MISQRERGELARFYTVTDPKKHKKGYTVYKVTARIISRKNPEDIQEITVWKRYSDFKKLHRDLWQIHRSLYRQPELFPPFAKAKVFGRFDESVIEERRQCSEDLLQFSANIPALYGSQHIQDFFKDGEVQDGSELIGPAEPFSDFLADSLSDCSSDVHKDIGGVDDLTGISQSEHGGPSSDSDLISLLVDGDSLAELDDGMASGGSSPKQPAGGSRRDASPSRPELEPSRGALFPSSLRKKDYLERASEQISLALQKEVEQDFTAALTYYRIGVDLLLQGVQGELNLSRREAVKKKTAEYLMRAEVISNTHLKGIMGQSSTQNRTLAAQCCKGSWGHQSQADELHNYRVLGVIDKVLLVMDKRTQETLILKGLRKSSECARVRKTVVPRAVPNMVRLRKFIISDDSIFLLLQYAEGGKLWSHITKYLHADSPDNSFDIPFIQKSHVASGHQAGTLDATPGTSGSASSRPSLELQEEGATTAGLTQLGAPGLGESGRVAPLANSGDTSEEECTNSYLTLCNEYEQEKVESEVLGEEEEDAEEAEEDPHVLGGEGSAVAMGQVRAKARSSLSADCLCSPITAQELCFFTEEEEPREPPHLIPLDQSIHSSTELFPVNSKESTGISRTLFSTSDLGSEVTDVTEDPLEVGEVVEVKGHVTDLWRFDSDQGSNESVPVISFKEAMVEDATACYVDDGRPPDLLVNLPGVGGVTGVTVDDLEEELVAAGVAFAVEAKPSPKFGKPDVLQLGEEAGLDLSFERDVSTSSVSCSHSDTDVQRDHTSSVHSKTGSRTLSSSPLLSGSASPSSLLTPPLSQSDPMLSPDPHPRPASAQSLAAAGTGPEEPGEGRSVSELFRQLDGLAEVALHTHIPETLVRTWAVDMLLALDALHQEGIICRDLNPSNILLDHRGHVELTYFCSWSEVEELCDPNAVAKMYCAPEVGGISEETAACDWWSLGALLYELLTGKSLHQCHPAGIGRHTSLNVPEFVSEEARSLLEQLLQYNPVERLGTGGAGVEDIKSHPFFAQVNWPK